MSAATPPAPWVREQRRGVMMERAGGLLMMGGPLLAGGAYMLVAWLFPSIEDMVPLALGMLVTLPIALVLSRRGAFRLAYLGKQHQAHARAAALAGDSRPPVLYLRPFSADETPGATLRGVTGVSLIGRFGSLEEQLSLALEPVGPLVAIGKPSEALPTPGALRRYASDDDWQALVRGWFDTARLVILRPGFSEGLWWELREALARLPPQRVLILAVRMRGREYRHFAELCAKRLGRQLPPLAAVSRWRRVNGFIAFGEGWQPVFLPMRAPLLRGDAALPLLAPLHYALAPVFGSLGIAWQPAQWSRYRILSFAVASVSVVAFAAMYLIDTFLH
jgi:hypothetical protein